LILLHHQYNRDTLELWAPILDCIKAMQNIKDEQYLRRLTALPKYAIIKKLYTSYGLIDRHLNLLIQVGYIQERILLVNRSKKTYSRKPKSVRIFRLTEKGDRFLQMYHESEKMLTVKEK
jgi:predicted transcriptional regulator